MNLFISILTNPKKGGSYHIHQIILLKHILKEKGTDNKKCELMTPISDKLFYNSTVGEYLITDVDTRS